MVDCLEAAVKNVLPITMRACHFSTASDDPTDAIALRKYISHECRCEVSGCDGDGDGAFVLESDAVGMFHQVILCPSIEPYEDATTKKKEVFCVKM